MGIKMGNHLHALWSVNTNQFYEINRVYINAGMFRKGRYIFESTVTKQDNLTVLFRRWETL